MARTGNELWWSQVLNKQAELKLHYAEAEMEVFTTLIRTMVQDGLSMSAIKDHMKDVFEIGQSAFYTRLKRMGARWVLPIELRKEA